MENIKAIGVKRLKDNLSVYLKEVQHGVRILVTDRDRVIAELREPSLSSVTTEENPIYTRMVQEGSILPATRNEAPLPPTGIQLKGLSTQKILEELREEGERLP